jgi:hypothetical protein
VLIADLLAGVMLMAPTRAAPTQVSSTAWANADRTGELDDLEAAE